MMRKGVFIAIAFLVGLGAADAQDAGRQQDATIMAVDADRGLAIIALNKDNGIRLYEVPIPEDTKFVTADGKKIADGLKDPMFQSRSNRLAIPVRMQYGTGDASGSIAKITVK
jgi:hypothetical protein